MCSVDPDEIVEMTRAVDGLDISSGSVMCRRCNTEKATVVLRIKDAYCRGCFLSYFVHKFRSTIGKSKQIRPGDRILIATSGGLSSSALLHLVREGLDESSHKKLRFDPSVIYIDESCLSSDTNSGPEFIDKICSNVLSMKFPCYVTSLEQIMSSQPSSPVLYAEDGSTKFDSNPVLKEQLDCLMSSCKSESAKLDLLEQLRRELLRQCAESLGYEKVFLAENATTLSIAILAKVAMGRGSQLADRVQFKGLHKDLEIFRPMREILLNEIQYYTDIHNITAVEAPGLKIEGSSITACTEQFVMGLQKEFPATIPTIFRTGDKLVSSSDSSKCSTPDVNGHVSVDDLNSIDYNICVMCGLNLDTMQSEASAVHATKVSQQLSRRVASGTPEKPDVVSSCLGVTTSGKNGQNTDGCCSKVSSDSNTDSKDCSQGDGCCGGREKSLKQQNEAFNRIPKNILDEYLCYGCRIIAREMVEFDHLPAKVRASVAEKERRKQMRDQIQDFLL